MATNVKKKSTAGGGKGFTYKYTDLATIHEELEKQGITYYQYTVYDEKAGDDYIYTVITRRGENNEVKESASLRGVRIVDGKTLAGGNAAQQYGSALTYARRYSLLMALGWATEDDDAASVGSASAQSQSHANYAPHDGGGRLDFEQVKARLEQLSTVAEVNEAKAKLLVRYNDTMTEKQRVAISRIFATRIEHIENGDSEPNGWQPAKAVK